MNVAGNFSSPEQLNKVIRALMGKGLIEYTLPDKPNSRMQKYRLTNREEAYITRES